MSKTHVGKEGWLMEILFKSVKLQELNTLQEAP